MHRRSLNHATLSFVLRPRGPLLVKSGLESADPTRPGMEFVRTRHPALGETVYIPGTSLKGTLRSQAERLLSGVGVSVCSPFHGQSECRAKSHDREASSETYKRQCRICRTFGSLSVAGRCNLTDAYPWDPQADEATRSEQAAVANATERRTQVGISRQDGSVAGGTLFDLEVAVGGAFWGEAQLDNFQLWQLGLLAAALDDVEAGDVAVGFGKSRGLGQLNVELRALRCEWAAPSSRELPGAGVLADARERQDYGLLEGDSVRLPQGVTPERTWRGWRITATGEPLRTLIDTVKAGPLQASVDALRPRGKQP